MTKLLVIIASLVLGAAVAVASYAANADARSSRHGVKPRGATSQCRLPVSQRTGGWVCPGG